MRHHRLLAAVAVALACACSTQPSEPPASPSKIASPEAEPGAPLAEPAAPAEPKPGSDEGAEGKAAPADGSDPSAPKTKIEFRPGTDPCKTDADCVKATCCHADACVSRDKAPSCKDAVCTLECRMGTMDCGGGCVCQDGKCGAKVWMGWDEPPPGER